MQLRCVLTGVAAITLAAPLQAQAVTPAPTPATAPSYDDIQLFYLAHPGLSVWLANDDGRAAAAKIVALLKESRIDGFEQGPQLAASAALALARGSADDDAIISTAWVRYVQALKAPVIGVTFGDPTLQPKPPTAGVILSAATAAPSLSAYVDRASAVNPLYAALRRTAVAQQQQDDPHVRATLGLPKLTAVFLFRIGTPAETAPRIYATFAEFRRTPASVSSSSSSAEAAKSGREDATSS